MAVALLHHKICTFCLLFEHYIVEYIMYDYVKEGFCALNVEKLLKNRMIMTI